MDIEVKHEFGGKVRTVLFNRPTKKNAITAAMYASLAEQLAEASASPEDARCSITGAGGTLSRVKTSTDFVVDPPSRKRARCCSFCRRWSGSTSRSSQR